MLVNIYAFLLSREVRRVRATRSSASATGLAISTSMRQAGQASLDRFPANGETEPVGETPRSRRESSETLENAPHRTLPTHGCKHIGTTLMLMLMLAEISNSNTESLSLPMMHSVSFHSDPLNTSVQARQQPERQVADPSERSLARRHLNNSTPSLLSNISKTVTVHTNEHKIKIPAAHALSTRKTEANRK